MAYRIEIPRCDWLVRCGDRQLAVSKKRPRICEGEGHPARDEMGHGRNPEITGLPEEDRSVIRNIFVPVSCGFAFGSENVAVNEIALEPSPMRVSFLRDGAVVGVWDIDACLSSAEEPYFHVAVHGEGLRLDLSLGGATAIFDSMGLLSGSLLEMAHQVHPTLGHFPLILCRRPIGSSTTSFVLEGHRVTDEIVKAMLPAGIHGIIGFKAEVHGRLTEKLHLKQEPVIWPRSAGAGDIN